MKTLTPAEILVMQYIIGGYTNKEIARLLKINVRTVETHRLNLRKKLNVNSKRELVTKARMLNVQPI